MIGIPALVLGIHAINIGPVAELQGNRHCEPASAEPSTGDLPCGPPRQGIRAVAVVARRPRGAAGGCSLRAAARCRSPLPAAAAGAAPSGRQGRCTRAASRCTCW